MPELRARWETAGSKTTGTWTEVFGGGPATDEIFMAWHYARYLDRAAAAGAAAYPIPFYANAWLNRPKARPGDYPSGGPLPHVLDLWQAGAPHLSLVAPDIYPAYNAFGFSPFAIDADYSIPVYPASPADRAELVAAYGVLRQIAPLVLEHQGALGW